MTNGVTIPPNFDVAPQPTLGGVGVPPTGLVGLEQAIGGGLQTALGTLGGGLGSAQAEIDIGNVGLESQAALAGLRGPEAQASAFANFQQSPGQQFLTEQAERALTRNAAATGGLGGGNVLQELQRQAIGLAQQDFSNQFQRGQQVLGSQQASARDLSGLAAQGGILGSQLISGAAGDIGAGRFTTGQQLAQAASGTTAGLANLQNQLGAGQANILGQGTTNLANLVSGTGTASSALQQQLAQILANIGTGTAASAATPISLAGQFDAAGILGQNAAVQGALGQLLETDFNFGTNTNTNTGFVGGGSGTTAFDAGGFA